MSNPSTAMQQAGSKKEVAQPESHIDTKTQAEELDWLGELRNFAQGFREFRPTTGATTQAGFGIGPVKYDLLFEDQQGIPEKPLLLLDKVIRIEKLISDRRIRFEATLMSVVFGKEDPISWIPAAQRFSIRVDGRHLTKKIIDKHNLASEKVSPCDILSGLINACDGLTTGPNPSELAFIARTAPKEREMTLLGQIVEEPLYPWLTPGGIKQIIYQRRKQRLRVAGTRRLTRILLATTAKDRLAMKTRNSKQKSRGFGNVRNPERGTTDAQKSE